jgi:hypothetical protein
MQISPREKKMLAYGGVVVLIIVFYMILTSGGAKTVKGQVPYAKAVKDNALNERNVIRLSREMKDLEPHIATLASDAAPDELVPRTIRDLQEIAAKAGVHIREVKPIRPKVLQSGLGSSVPLEVHFLAPFKPNTVKFLYLVEDPSGKMVVDKLDITSADPRQKTVEVAAQITVYTRSTAAGSAGSDTSSGSSASSSR